MTAFRLGVPRGKMIYEDVLVGGSMRSTGGCRVITAVTVAATDDGDVSAVDLLFLIRLDQADNRGVFTFPFDRMKGGIGGGKQLLFIGGTAGQIGTLAMAAVAELRLLDNSRHHTARFFPPDACEFVLGRDQVWVVTVNTFRVPRSLWVGLRQHFRRGVHPSPREGRVVKGLFELCFDVFQIDTSRYQSLDSFGRGAVAGSAAADSAT